MTTDELLKKHGIIKYRGKLIHPERGKYYFRGIPYNTLFDAEIRVDASLIKKTELKEIKK